jgi:hypothetical protein
MGNPLKIDVGMEKSAINGGFSIAIFDCHFE